METLFPDWLPNVHPLLVHFPIAIFITGIVADAAYLFLKKEWLRRSVASLFVLAALAALVTYFSGKQAIDMVSVPLRAELTASHHADWGLYTLIYFGSYGAVRALLYWKALDKNTWMAALLFCAGLAGAGFVAKTADLGGRLVYKYGVGVQKQK